MTISIQEFGYRRVHRLRGKWLAIAIPAAIGNEWNDVAVVDMIATHKNGVQSIIVTPVHGYDPTKPQDEETALAADLQKKKVREQAREQVPEWFGRNT